MIIDLQEPFKSKWKKGYLVVNKEPRRNVILFNSNSDRTTISYARYLVSVNLNRFLDNTECVDHINGNRLDDRIENYQILTAKQNNIKRFTDSHKTELMLRIKCGGCGVIFDKAKNKSHLIIKSKKSTYCSRRCAGVKKQNESVVIKEFRKGFEDF